MPEYCLSATQSHMLRVCGARFSEMLQLTQLNNPRRRCLWAVLVLCAVCMLTVRVATRYCYTHGASESRAASVLKHRQPQSGSQRMTKSSLVFAPPAVRSAVLDTPTSYPRVAPAGPPLPGLMFDESLYNRPPPIS